MVGFIMKCSKLKNEVLKTGEWTEKVDAVVDSSKDGRILNEVLKTEEWAEKVDAVVDSSKDVIGGDWSEQHGNGEEYSLFIQFIKMRDFYGHIFYGKLWGFYYRRVYRGPSKR